MIAFEDKLKIERLILGDEQVFSLIYKEYSQKVYRLAFRYLKNESRSEEIVQETFIRIWISREGLDPNGVLWSFISVIAKRLALNALRDISRSAVLIEKLLINVELAHSDIEEKVYGRELARNVESLISKLPLQQQLVFKLSRVEGLSHKEIAQQLHISPNTVKNHMVQALKTLKSNLQFNDLIYILIFVYLYKFF